jgi:hypothetical protein
VAGPKTVWNESVILIPPILEIMGRNLEKRKEKDTQYNNLRLPIFLALICFIVFASLDARGAEEPKAAMKADKTGTNPVNFTYDFRLYNEFVWLNTDGDGEQNVTTVEFRAPFADGKWQFRVKARAVTIEADVNDDGVDDLDESGFGDVGIRLLTVPYLDMSKKLAFAVGFETFLNTASEDELGSGTTSLGPQAFLVFFKPFGINGLFAPGYQHKFSVDEDDGRSEIHQGLIDLNFLWLAQNKQYWFFCDPQIVLDYEENKEYLIIDLSVGAMLDRYLGTKGHSAYLRPSIGVGTDRPTDGSIEVGYKIIF